MKNILTAILFFISVSLFSQDEKRLALVIGNANYDKGELKNPVNDARLIASTLDSLDFDVILKENLATKRDMTSAIREFGTKRSEYNVAVVYYAGHGIQVNDENFLLPTKEVFEQEFDVLDYGVSVQNVMRYLTAQSNEINILILDACRDNPFESNWNATRSLKGGGLAKIPPPTGSLIAFSTDSGQTAPDGDGDNSIYSISLSRNLLLEDISIDQVFRNVRAEVLAESDGMQRPVEATQLVGKSFVLKKNFSIYESTVDEIINFCDQKILNSNFEEAIEIMNSAADIFRSKQNFKDEIILREKIVDEYLFKEFEDNLPRHLSLNIRNVNYQKTSYEKFKEVFNQNTYGIFIKNFINLLTNEGKNYLKYIDKNYFNNLYRALDLTIMVINSNFYDLDFIQLPKLELETPDNQDDGLTSFWKAKTKHMNFREKPFSGGKYLVENHHDMDIIMSSEINKIINGLDLEISIEKNKKNQKLVDYTIDIYQDINRANKQIILDILGYVNTSDTEELFNILEKVSNDYTSFFLKKNFTINDFIDLYNFPWYEGALINQISRSLYFSSVSEERLKVKLEELKAVQRYCIFLLEEIKNISFEDKEKIKSYNSFVERSFFVPGDGKLQLFNTILDAENIDNFSKTKNLLLSEYNKNISGYDFVFSTIDQIKNQDYKILENKDLLTEWPLMSHELLWKLYLGYLTHSSIENNSSSGFFEKMSIFEKEYKQNYINEVWVNKYVNMFKQARNNADFFWQYEYLTSLKLTEELIEINYGSADDILFLNYADLHNKLFVSSKSNFVFNPFKLKEKLVKLTEQSRDSQNFLIKIYLEDLNTFFNKNSPFYLNSLNHFSENELKTVFDN